MTQRVAITCPKPNRARRHFLAWGRFPKWEGRRLHGRVPWIRSAFARLLTITLLLLVAFEFKGHAQRQMERLGRGVVAVRRSTTQVYVGWRMLGTDPDNVAFNVYRSSGGGSPVKLNNVPLYNTTDYLDTPGTFSMPHSYFVRPILNGVELPPSAAFTLPAGVPVRQYISVPLQRPPDGVTPDGVNFTYSPNDCSVGDLDGDGEYELVVKWDPSNSKDNSQSGYTGNVYLDAYKLDGTFMWRIDLGWNIRAGAHYTQFIVYDLDGDGRAEIACKTAPGTIDGQGNFVLMPGDDPYADYRNSNGYILFGPEYLTIFDGLAGAALTTTNYLPPRGNVCSWGDCYGNRVDRFLAAVAYLDGVRPSLVMCRGYYTRTVLVAWDWRNGQLTHRWTFDSNTPGNGAYAGQGAHSLTVGDVDGDGMDEIVYGACTIDHDGTGLYSTGLGHGDALHMSDMDPSRPGQEIWMVHESPALYGPHGLELHDAATGRILFGVDGEGSDVGRGVAFDIDPRFPGYECWGSRGGLYNVSGTLISSTRPSQMNFGVWWDADPLRELLDGTTISKWNWTAGSASTLLSPAGVASNNGTKANPALSADILGDWREEVMWRNSNNQELRVYISTIPATNRFRTFMHDPQYRVAIAWQNVGYNQPPHPGFFVGADMPTPPLPPISDAQLIWQGGFNGNAWDASTANWRSNATWVGSNVATMFSHGMSVLFDLTGSNHIPINLIGELVPGNVTVHSPRDYVFAGSGSIVGGEGLIKSGIGTLVLNNTNSFIRETLVNQGSLVVNGTLAQSSIVVQRLGSISGVGIVIGNASLEGTLSPGVSIGALTFVDSLTLQSGSTTVVELSKSPLTNDLVRVHGMLTFGGTLKVLPPVNGSLAAGDTFKMFDASEYAGSFSLLDLPLIDAALKWESNFLAVDGTLRVASKWEPVITSISLQAGSLVLIGKGGVPGGPMYVLSSPIISRPVHLWERVGTNHFDVRGEFLHVVPFDASASERFYRIQLP